MAAAPAKPPPQKAAPPAPARGPAARPPAAASRPAPKATPAPAAASSAPRPSVASPPAPKAPSAPPSPAPAPKPSTVKAPEAVTGPEEAPAKARPPSRALQLLVEGIAIASFIALAIVPLARFGLLPLRIEEVHLILAVASLLLTGGVLAFDPAGFAQRRRSLDEQIMRKYRRDLILTMLSVGGTFVVAIMLVLEGAALLAFLGLISRTSEASIAFAENYVLFGTFTLLFCSMLLIVRTSFETRVPMKLWQKGVAWALLSAAAVVAIVSLLVNYGILDRGPFAQIEPRQSIYVLTLGVLFQIVAFKLLLRYPAIAQIVTREIEAARRANKELRDQIQRRALRAYFGGMGFVLLSMFLLGGVATRQLPTQNERSLNFIVIGYAILGIVVMGLVFTRFLQHRFLDSRKRRATMGELVAKKRLSKGEINLRVMYTFSIFFGSVFALTGLAVLFGLVSAVAPKYGTDFLILAFLSGVGPYGWHRGRLVKRIRAMDDKFPDFLRDLAESERAGMTLPRALQSASKGVYGALTPEIRHMNAQVEWGVSFTDALQRFAKRVKTPLIERTVALIVEASRAGGNVIDILTAASDDAREIKQILTERGRQMGIYGIIIYIAYFVFLVVVFVLSAQFLPAFHEAASASTGTQVAGASIQQFNPDDFITVFFHAAIVQAIGGGLISGIMVQGHPLSGLKHAVTMTVIAWVFFRVLIG